MEWLTSDESKTSPPVTGHYRGNVTEKPNSTTFSSVNPDKDEDAAAYNSEVMKEHLERPDYTKGAVIALSFGILLTAILVVFAVCHFCIGRRGSWKGRRVNVEGEPDYLVDGMYL